MEYKYQGVCPVINLPFKEDGSVDFEDMSKEIELLIFNGIKSICLFAFNTEPHKLTWDEKKETIVKFLQIVNKRTDTIIGIVENSITGGKELAKLSEDNGADGIILYPPSLSTPSGDALLGYFKSIADSVKLDVMIQDNPRSTGVNMTTEFILRAFNEIPNFNYIKVECPIPVRKMKQLIAATDGRLKCYSGNGGIHAVNAFLSGAWGIMPGAVTASYFNKMYMLLGEGKTDEARSLFEKILPLVWFEDQSLEFYISCEKELLKHEGIFKTAKCREPFTGLTEDDRKELFALYKRLF